MAKARTLDKRRKSIRNIKKITRTMELIATARYRKAMDRATAATAYTRRIPQVDLEVSGKRGIGALKFRKIDIQETFTQFEDQPKFGEVEAIANRYLDQ